MSTKISITTRIDLKSLARATAALRTQYGVVPNSYSHIAKLCILQMANAINAKHFETEVEAQEYLDKSIEEPFSAGDNNEPEQV